MAARKAVSALEKWLDKELDAQKKDNFPLTRLGHFYAQSPESALVLRGPQKAQTALLLHSSRYTVVGCELVRVKRPSPALGIEEPRALDAEVVVARPAALTPSLLKLCPAVELSPAAAAAAPEASVAQPDSERASPEAVRAALFGEEGEARPAASASAVPLASGEFASRFLEAGGLGRLVGPDGTAGAVVELNTGAPFCVLMVGVQGSGKSHSVGCVIESCLLPCEPAVRLRRPHCALVLHYDKGESSVCEAVGLVCPRAGFPAPSALPRERLLVLVSPSFYLQRRAFYRGLGVAVRPLLFSWAQLDASTLRMLMGLGAADGQLYVTGGVFELLKRYQRRGGMPELPAFERELKARLTLAGQAPALEQRMRLLKSMLLEAPENEALRCECGATDLRAIVAPGTLIVADMTDPLLTPQDANAIFQVLVEQFRAVPASRCARLLVADEAHKYMDGTKGADGLAGAIVDVARLMRHDGMRVMVSSQSPCTLAPELLELASVVLLHCFYSSDWFAFLRKKLPLPHEHEQLIRDLPQGYALAIAPHHRVEGVQGSAVLIKVRQRITMDLGVTRGNDV
jgi:hypothetical protein